MRSKLITQKPPTTLTQNYQISHKKSLYYEQTPADIIEQKLLKLPEKYSYAPKSTKTFSSLNLEGETILQLQKWFDTIQYDFYQYLSTSNIWTVQKYPKPPDYDISIFVPPPEIHTKSDKENKTIRNSQETFQSTFSKVLLFIHHEYQNQMSNLLLP